MHAAVSAVGVDQPGIVAAVSSVLYDIGANVEDSRMAILGAHFSMMLIVALPEGVDPATLESKLLERVRALDLVVNVRPVAEVPAEHAQGTDYIVSVYGSDRPGIVARICTALADRRVNIRDLATHMLDGGGYLMLLEVVVPAGADVAAIERDLTMLGDELGVEASLRPMEAETL